MSDQIRNTDGMPDGEGPYWEEDRVRLAVERMRGVVVPDLTARVMAAIPERAGRRERRTLIPGLARAVRWFWEPRPISLALRPAYVVCLALGLAFLFLFSVREPAPPAATLYVQFRLEAPGASRVEVAGSFTGWHGSVELSETTPGLWSALVPLEPGVHDYTFIIDGSEWVVDPAAPQVDDGFGGSNSRLFLTQPLGNV